MEYPFGRDGKWRVFPGMFCCTDVLRSAFSVATARIEKHVSAQSNNVAESLFALLVEAREPNGRVIDVRFTFLFNC